MPVIIIGACALLARFIFGAPFDPDRKSKGGDTVIRVQQVRSGTLQAKPQKGSSNFVWYVVVIAFVIYLLISAPPHA